MKYLLIIIVVSVSLLGCAKKNFTPIQNNITDNDLPTKCSGLTETLNSKWLKHKSLNYYWYDKELFSLLENKYMECIVELDRGKIKMLFGEPYKSSKSHIFYFLKKECLEYKNPCYQLVFNTDKESGNVNGFYVQERFAID